jgi:hypothetical protein
MYSGNWEPFSQLAQPAVLLLLAQLLVLPGHLQE